MKIKLSRTHAVIGAFMLLNDMNHKEFTTFILLT